jgi:membrane protein YqaA with SNARE-associated domain
VLAPMALAKPERAYRYALICTLASVAGGLLGYAIGAFFYQTIGAWLISIYGGAQKVEGLLALYRDYGALLILIKGLTPIPFKFVTIASGIAGYDLVWFVLLCLLTRGVRFYAVAGLMTRFGPRLQSLLQRHGGLIAAGVLVMVIAGFFMVRWLL